MDSNKLELLRSPWGISSGAKVITLGEAIAAIEKCEAVITADGHLVRVSLSEVTGDNDNEFAYFGWKDAEGADCSVKFKEGNNGVVYAMGSVLAMEDTEGELFAVQLLTGMTIRGDGDQ